MTKFSRWLGGLGLAAMMGVMLFGAAGIYGATDAEAQSPPSPPHRHVGSVTIDGEPAAAGTTVEARIDGNACGNTAVSLEADGEARYTLDVPAADPTMAPNCGTDGATITFLVGGVQAQETGTWSGDGNLGIVDLTVITPDDDDAADDAADDVADDAADDVADDAADDTADDATDDDVADDAADDAVAPTPGPPATGTGTGAGSFSAVWLLAALGLGAAAFGAAGTVVARRK